ncbi:putative SOS response-associated peptidase YedK [Paraburkholderia atlantica]
MLVAESGQRVVLPMRYQCRIAGKRLNYDVRFPNTYNARRDNLEGCWKPCFGDTHGIMVVDVFYENVSKAKAEGRTLAEGEKDENLVAEFRPEDDQPMPVACLWSRWTAPGQPDLMSFAAITDKPPPEVAAAGHDRGIIPIKPENVEAWLHPDPSRRWSRNKQGSSPREKSKAQRTPCVWKVSAHPRTASDSRSKSERRSCFVVAGPHSGDKPARMRP